MFLVGLNIFFYMDSRWAWDAVQANGQLSIEPTDSGAVPLDIAYASLGYLAVGTMVLFAGIAMFAQRTRVARFILGIALFLIFVFFDVNVWLIYLFDFLAISALFLFSYKESFIDSVRRR